MTAVVTRGATLMSMRGRVQRRTNQLFVWLFVRQHRGKLNLYDTTHIIVQVLVALQYMHDQGIVHRNLKPGNIRRGEMDKKAMTQPPADEGTAPIQSSLRLASTAASVLTVEPWYNDGFGCDLAKTGLLDAGVSMALFRDASSLDDDANHATSQFEVNALRDKASRRSLLGTVIGIGGAGLLVPGVIKLIIHDSSPRSAAALNVRLTGNGLVLFGTF